MSKSDSEYVPPLGMTARRERGEGAVGDSIGSQNWACASFHWASTVTRYFP